jgi:uncharacterized protein YggE
MGRETEMSANTVERRDGAPRSAKGARNGPRSGAPDGPRRSRFAVLVLALIFIPVVLSGCGGALSSSAGSAGPAAGAGADTVTVTGQATVTSAPDEAVVVLTVENDADTAPAAMDATSAQSKQMLDRLKSDGIPDSSIQTSSITLYPIRTYDPNTGKESLGGYRAQNSIKVTLQDAATVAKVLAAGVETGATLVSGPDWRLRDDSQAVNEALGQAVANARAKAESLAVAGGVSLGGVLTISEGSVQVPVMPMYSAAGAADSSKIVEPPVSSGNLDVTATVTVTYALRH